MYTRERQSLARLAGLLSDDQVAQLAGLEERGFSAAELLDLARLPLLDAAMDVGLADIRLRGRSLRSWCQR